jgi:uncharacterized membrane protein YhiD involved in acid resistance
MEIFNLQGVTSEFTVLDVALVLTLSFVLSSAIGWIYQVTHRGTSYTQSFVFTLVLNGMVVALVMLIVGSDIARAFSLVGALSIIRFRNAVKETRDVGFIFFTMAVGMAIGTRFYLLGIIATIFISLVIVLMNRFNWFSKEMSSQILRILVPDGLPFDTVFDRVFLKYTQSSDLISADTVESGLFTELTYSVGLKRSTAVEDFLTEIKKLNGNYQVSLITGYSGVDL